MAGLAPSAERWHRSDFYRIHRAEDHFITEPMVANRLAEHIARRINRRWKHGVDVFDIGAGDGSLVRALAELTEHRVHGIDIRNRPSDVEPAIGWQRELPEADEAVVICHEFLDDVPCDIVEIDAAGQPCLLLFDDESNPVLGPRLSDPAAGADRSALLAWMKRWWPSNRPLSRVEIGLQRDVQWRELLRRIKVGQAFAIDYGHLLNERMAGTWDGGTIIGFRRGHAVASRFSNDRNITAHVAMDSIARSTPFTSCRLTRQRRIMGSSIDFGRSTGARGDYLWLEVEFGATT